MNRKRVHHLLIIALLMMIANADIIANESASQTPDIAGQLLHPSNRAFSPATGDILIWSNTSIDSLIIQELTDGLYSHCGLVYRDENDDVWIMDSFPRIGLRVLKLQDYVRPRGTVKLIHVSLLRYKSAIQLETLNRYIQELIQHKNHVTFDKFMILDSETLKLEDLKFSSHAMYCAEIICWIYCNVTNAEHFYVNDFDRVMKRWDLLAARAKKEADPLDLAKLFYIRLYLNKLKADKRKILISPNGMLRSGSFEIIQEILNITKPPPIKKSLAAFPESSPTSS